MKLTFNINYDTVFGEEVLLNIVETDSKGAKKTSQFRMNNRDGKHWWYELNRKEATLNTSLDYYYSVDCAWADSRHEWLTETHRLEFALRLTTKRCASSCVHRSFAHSNSLL